MLRTRVITAAVLLAILLALVSINSFPLIALAAGIFFAAASWESLRLFDSKSAVLGSVIWTIAFFLLVFGGMSTQTQLLCVLSVVIWMVRLVPSLKIGLPPLASIGSRLLSISYGITILSCFIAILHLYKHSGLYLFSVLIIVWIADIGAYFAGKAFGKRKLAPSISPGKSWEGAVGGWIAVLLFMSISIAIPSLHDTFSANVQRRFGWFGYIIILTLLVATSIVGDLFESMLKRRAGMKDSSNLLPGHGGVLDRIDALIPTLSLAVLFDLWT